MSFLGFGFTDFGLACPPTPKVGNPEARPKLKDDAYGESLISPKSPTSSSAPVGSGLIIGLINLEATRSSCENNHPKSCLMGTPSGLVLCI